MHYCPHCGSTSFDDEGFCRGCGARLPKNAPAQSAPAQSVPPQSALPQSASLQSGAGSTNPPPSIPAKKPFATVASMDLAQPQIKNVWVAVMLALLFGPLGMLYCTVPGALVMCAISVVSLFFSKIVAIFVVPLVCAVWAGLAARSANSIY